MSKRKPVVIDAKPLRVTIHDPKPSPEKIMIRLADILQDIAIAAIFMVILWALLEGMQ